MKFATTATLIVGIATATSACLVPNVMCFSKTYRLEGVFRDTTPLDGNLNPIPITPTCTDATDLLQKDLSGLISVMDQVHAGEITISDQHALQRLDEMMTAIESGIGSSMSANHQDTYTETIEPMITQMRQNCVDWLSDPDYVNCTNFTATFVCDAFLVNPTRARYLNFDLGADYERPASSNGPIITKGADGWCYYYSNPAPRNDTEADPDGEESSTTGEPGGILPGDTGGDATGLDETGQGAAAPFGDLDTLIHCNDGRTACSYERVLVDNVMGAVSRIEADGVALRLLPPEDIDYPGVRLEGLDLDEASTELAKSLGFSKGDIIRAVNGKLLTDEIAMMEVIDTLTQTGTATLTYDRGRQTREVTITPR